MGTVIFEHKRYTLVQEPYIKALPNEKPCFKAVAVDNNGNHYEVTWDVVENWQNCFTHGDYSTMVKDWETASSVELI